MLTIKTDKYLNHKRVEKIIDSCDNCAQLNTAYKYLELFDVRFKDENLYNSLIKIYSEKKKVLVCEF